MIVTEQNRSTPVAAIRHLTAGMAVCLAVACGVLLSQAPGLAVRAGRYPHAYLALAAALFLGSAASAYASFRVRHISSRILSALQAIETHNGGLALITAVWSVALLTRHLEGWLLPGSWAAGCSVFLAAGFATALFLRVTGPRRLPSVDSLIRLPEAAWRWLAETAGSRPVLVALLVMLAVRAGLCIHSAATAPLFCDEAATVQLYAKSIDSALTRYDTPNNHLANSLLSLLTTGILGSSLMAIRLMAVIAGILSPLAVFVLAKFVFGIRAGLAAAALESASLWTLVYSFQARGYAFLSLLTPIVLFYLFDALSESDSPKRWRPFTVWCSISIAFIPTVVYFWGATLLFALAVIIYRSKTTGRSVLSRPLFVASGSFAAVAVFAASVYLNPVFYMFRTSLGFRNFHGNPEQPHSVAALAAGVGREFLLGRMPGGNPGSYEWFGWALAALAALGLVLLIVRRKGLSLVLTLCLLFAPLMVVVVQGDLPFVRHMSYLLAWIHVVAGFAIAEVLILAERIFSITRPAAMAYSAAILVLFGAAFWQSRIALSDYLTDYRRQTPATEVSDWLIRNTKAEDAIVCDTCLDYMVEHQIGSQRRIVTVMEWWGAGPPKASRIIAVPFRYRDDFGAQFLSRVCAGKSVPWQLTSIGQQGVYACGD